VVQPGETLFRIGLLYGLSWQVIAEANGITNPNYITVGTALTIPAH
jgi:nucleoid-associated protein YgaU